MTPKRGDDGLRIGDFIAVIDGRQITLHRIRKVTYTTFWVRASPRPIKFDRITYRERWPSKHRKCYKPSEHELQVLRIEQQCAALVKEASHLNDQIAALIRKAGCLPSETKLATLRSVILYMNRALKRTNALLPHAEVRQVDQGTSGERDDHSV